MKSLSVRSLSIRCWAKLTRLGVTELSGVNCEREGEGGRGRGGGGGGEGGRGRGGRGVGGWGVGE